MTRNKTTASRIEQDGAPPHDTFLDVDAFEQRLGAGIAQVGDGVPHAVLVFRVVGLTNVVESGGATAERVLLDVLRNVLDNLFGPEPAVARITADTFASLHGRCLPRDAPSIAARVKTGLEGGDFRWQQLHFRLGVCIGVLELGDVDSASGYLARAMRACDEAARLGGSGILMLDGHAGEEADLAEEQVWRERLREIVV